MNELSFYIPGFFENASVQCIKNIRKFYPDSSIIISSDAGPDYYNISKEYNCQFQYYPNNLGYPVMPYGYKKDKALEWMNRFYVACILAKGTHIMCAEDDVAIIGKIEIPDDCEIFAHNTPNNYVPDFVFDLCRQVSGVEPKTRHYGAGGGTIFKIDTYVNNYMQIVKLFDEVFDQILEHYPTFGWYDCFMTIVYFLCGKPYTINNGIFEIKPLNKNFDLTIVDAEKYPIVHLYKNYYPK